MSTHPLQTNRAGSIVSSLAVLVALLGWLVWATADQLPFGSTIKASAAVVVFQVFPGTLIWRTVRPRNGWLLEDLTMGFAMGFVIAVPSQVIAGLMHSRIPAIMIPLVIAAIFLAVPGCRRRIMEAKWSPTPWWFGVIIGLLSLSAVSQTLAYFKQNPLYSARPWGPHVDTYLHQALSAELLTRGPVGWPTVAGEDLGYQWFAHAWIANVTATSGVPLDHVLMRFLPVLMPVLAVASIAVLGLRLSGSPVVGVVAAGLSMAGGQGQPWGLYPMGLPITPLSPTLGLGIPTLIALILILALRWRGETLSGAVWLIPILTVIATGTKGSTSPIVIAGLALAAVAMLLWNRPMFWPVVRDSAMMVVALVATMALVFHGSVAGLKFDIGESSRQTALGSVLGSVSTYPEVVFVSGVTILAALTRAALVFALPFKRSSRVDPVTWVLIGAAIAGAMAVGIFSHPGKSQGYFTVTAIPLAATGSALGAQQLWRALGRKRSLILGAAGLVAAALFLRLGVEITGPVRRNYDRLTTVAIIAAVIVVVVAIVGMFLLRPRAVRGALSLVAVTGLLAGVGGWAYAQKHSYPVRDQAARQVTTPNTVTMNQIRTARFIRDHSNVDDLVMTNRHCVWLREPRNGCDSRRWVVTAFTERQSLVEGWTATPRATRIAPDGKDSVTVNYWKPEILKLNDDFIAAPTAAAQKKLWDLGVRWIYSENTRPHAKNMEPFATLGLRTPDASAWKLNPPK